MSLSSTAQPLDTRFPIIISSCFSKVTIGYNPSSAARRHSTMPPVTRYYERYTIRPRGIEAAASESGRPQGAVDLAQLQNVGCTHQFKVRRGPAGIIVYPSLVSHGGLYGGMRRAVRCKGEAGRGRHRRGHARPPALLADQVRLNAAHSSVGQSSLDDYPPGWRRVEEAQQRVGCWRLTSIVSARRWGPSRRSSWYGRSGCVESAIYLFESMHH